MHSIRSLVTKSTLLIVTLIMVFFAFSCSKDAPTAAPDSRQATESKLPDLHGKVIRAVTENAYAPLNFVDPKTGKGIGLEYDLVNEIGKRLNANIEWSVSSWDAMITAVRAGQFDVGMDGITINDERKKQVDFSDTYLVSEQFMLVRSDENRFTDEKTFKANEKLTIGAQAGTTNFYVAVYNVLDGNEKNPRIKLFETFGATVQALLAGDVDMVLMDKSSSEGYMGANQGKLKLIGGPLGTEEFGLIFTPKSELVASFNMVLAQMKNDGSLAALTKKWFYEYSAK